MNSYDSDPIAKIYEEMLKSRTNKQIIIESFNNTNEVYKNEDIEIFFDRDFSYIAGKFISKIKSNYNSTLKDKDLLNFLEFEYNVSEQKLIRLPTFNKYDFLVEIYHNNQPEYIIKREKTNHRMIEVFDLETFQEISVKDFLNSFTETSKDKGISKEIVNALLK